MDEQKREQLIAWLESMPWWDELPYAQLEELLESTHNVMVQRGERAIVLEAENTSLKDFVLWLTPCADDMPEYPPYKLIGEKAKALLTEQE